MKSSCRLVVGVALASFVFAAPVAAQDAGSLQVGTATISVGAGTQIITLPDVTSMLTLNNFTVSGAPLTQTYKFSDDFGDEIGWNINGSVSVPMRANKTVTFAGFWANIDGDDSAVCSGATPNTCAIYPLLDDPSTSQIVTFSPPVQFLHTAKREVDLWGASLESSWNLTPGVMGVTRAPGRRYVALGGDVRGIDQELDATFTIVEVPDFRGLYKEDLDTTYYGAYAAWGGDFPRFFLGGLWDRLGLHSTFRLQGGVYYADTNYQGILTKSGSGGNPTSSLSLDSDDAAFIGGLVMETSKALGRRATLSLRSEYEYYSWVPDMRYNQVDLSPGGNAGAGAQDGTVIGDDDAFSMRTSLRLTIKLGPDGVFETR